MAKDGSTDGARRLAFRREETRFGITLSHDRVNALIGADGPCPGGPGLAWPGVAASYCIVAAWDARQREVMAADPSLREGMWRPDVEARTGRRDPDQGVSMLFAHAVPGVFDVAWTILPGVALTALVMR